MPSKSNNIPNKMFYSAVSKGIPRICKATTTFQDFIKSAKILVGRIRKQRGNVLLTKNVLLNSEKLMIMF